MNKKYIMIHVEKPMIRLMILYIILSSIGCKKFLSAKSDMHLSIPTTIADLQAIIDLYNRVNHFDVGEGVNAADEFYLSDNDYNSLSLVQQRNLYIWNKDNVINLGANTWAYTYDNIYKANTIITGLAKIDINKTNEAAWNNLYGQALLLRAKSLFGAAVVWVLAYDSLTAKTNLGLPLRLNTDFNEPSKRSTLNETYIQIIRDLKRSIPYLPETPIHEYRASKPAACALMARVYLSMRRYDSCFKYVDRALSMESTLLDYNTLNADNAYPIPRFNVEVIMENRLNPSFATYVRVDSTLYKMFEDNDLRKKLLFKPNGDGSYSFHGSYEGNVPLFGGVATDELYLMRAECYARKGNTSLAINDLNTLLINRYKKGTYNSIRSNDANQVLKIVLAERRKELMMRGLRWMDIKRLNLEGADITLKRVINSKTIILPPNDPRYAMAIPDDVINISGMQQNPR